MPANELHLDNYPIGVICALPVEKVAFVAMLDKVHESLQTPKNDENSYTFGEIGKHNIVVACLPAGLTGNNSAATVAKDMLRSFRIKIGLMVGIGGGIWSKRMDIRLGDVVISQPDGTHGGVVQWDFGKMEHDGFRRTGSLNKPPRPLLNAVQDMKEKHMLEGDELADNLARMIQNKPKLARTFVHQGFENDCLYEATYNHAGGETCDNCATEKAINRTSRTTTDPQVHYGNIASGNEVVKNGEFRDRIAKDLGIICFEMEAAGLMDSFPCLVIRGICDYADSHKNKRWQPYAAATAAAYAKELIGVLKKQGVDELKPAISYRTPFSLDGVPKARHFVDRPTEMEELERVLIPGPIQKQRQEIHVLRGLGGMGKTQLAVEFARRHHPRFSSVFWLDGRTKDILKRSIAKCASRIPPGHIPETSRSYAADSGSDINAVVRDVMGWLSHPDNKEWLLIFDNIDREHSPDVGDPDAYDVERYFSGADHGSILITTRLAKLEQLGNSHHLGKVSMAQGQAIFESWYKGECDETERDHLLEMLDGLPLAIAQAGAYIQTSGAELEKYIAFYKQQWDKLMRPSPLNDPTLKDYPDRSVWTTWTISYYAIREKNEDTANLLLLWSFLDNKDLWYGLFKAAYKQGPITTRTISKWIGEVANSEIQFTGAMRLLRNYSLVEEITGTTSYATHPVVHQWTRHSQGRQFERELRQLAVVVVGRGASGCDVSNYYALQRRLLPHAQVCFKHVVGTEVFDRLGAEEDADENLDQCQEHHTFLSALHDLGLLYYDQSKFSETEELYTLALRGMENTLGPSNISTLGLISDMGTLYGKQGKLLEAEKMYKQALRGTEEVPGPHHRSTQLVIHNNLGNLYREQGKLAEAEKMYERALGGYEEVIGKEHLEYHLPALVAFHGMGRVYSDHGMLAKAEKLYERAHRGYEETLGKDNVNQHQQALDVLWNMGILYEKQGEIAKAKAVWERALSGYSTVLGLSSEECKELVRMIERLSVSEEGREAGDEKHHEEESAKQDQPKGEHEDEGHAALSTTYIVGEKQRRKREGSSSPSPQKPTKKTSRVWQ